MIRLAAKAIAGIVLSPVMIGCVACIVGSFGRLDGPDWSLAAWRDLLAEPGLVTSVVLTLGTGTAATLLAVVAAILVTAACHDRPAERLLLCLTPPLLAVPHLVTALGLLMLTSPSGLMVRLVAPLVGWDRPPDWPVPQDPWGIGLTLGLACRETPFVVFVLAAVTDRPTLAPQLAAARALGRSTIAAWWQVALPQLYPRIRLPALAVLAYGVGNVDMALILGPTAPAPLAVRVLDWFTDADLASRPRAFAGATLLLLLIGAVASVWRALEISWSGRTCRAGTVRGEQWRRWSGRIVGALVLGLLVASLAVLSLWSVAETWRFPALWPTGLGLSPWVTSTPTLWGPFLTSLALGSASSITALLLVLVVRSRTLRYSDGRGGALELAAWLPLVVPQMAFVFGAQVLWIVLGVVETPVALWWAHTMMALPYVLSTLAGPLARFSAHMGEAGLTLGHRRWSVWRRIELPLLLRPILAAAAIGFAVSCAQYVVTLAAGGGRFATLATETMALASGGDRRRIGVAGLTLALLPFLAMLAALALPASIERRRQPGNGANRFSMSSSLKARPAPPPPSRPS